MPATKEYITRADLSKLVDTMDRWRVQSQATLEKHDKTLYGNGEPGIDEKIRNIYNILQVLNKLAWIVVGSVVTLSVSGLIYAVMYFVKNTP